MKSIFLHLLVLCSLLAGAPAPASAGAQAADAKEKAALAALSQPSLLHQSAGERILIVEGRGRGWDHGWGRGWGYGPDRHYEYGVGFPIVILTVVILSVLVIGLQPVPFQR